MDTCLPNGQVERLIVSKKHGQELYTAARKSTWGDMFYVDQLVEAEVKAAENPRRKWREMKDHAKEKRRAEAPKSPEQLLDSVVDHAVESLKTTSKLE